MFICDDCLLKHYTNEPSWGRSRGSCEICRIVSGCSDIPSRALRPRTPVPQTVVGATREKVRREASVQDSPLDRVAKILDDEDFEPPVDPVALPGGGFAEPKAPKKKAPVSSGRTCSRCGRKGHDARTCSGNPMYRPKGR